MGKHPVLMKVTEGIITKSRPLRSAYLERMHSAIGQGKVKRAALSCTNLAHAFAAMPPTVKIHLKQTERPNLAIVSSYNDMLSAHQPLGTFPTLIKDEALKVGATAQFAGGVPAMCDGITQGQPGMELSLFSRDVIAMSTAVALSHAMFDAALYLGVCDKIVPGLLIGALSFGHLPAIFVPAGPMTTGLSNDIKATIRQRYAEGKITREALLESEAQSYHGPGTCTFYGTANSNQMLMEIMGLHLPGSAFVTPGTALREELTRACVRTAATISFQGTRFTPIVNIVEEKTIVNAIVGLLATGGSTNHTLHLVAIARAAGIIIDWNDFAELSSIIPLLARVYPNGEADINHFHAAGGMGFIIRELLNAGLLHDDVNTIVGPGLSHYTQEARLDNGILSWQPTPTQSIDCSIVRSMSDAFSPDGGLKVLNGNIGRSIIKVSAVQPQHRQIEAPAIVFHDQDQLLAAFKQGELERDFIAVIRFQGPRANGMPELHKLTPTLSALQERGFRVALVTDGRMSGASGKVPAAIHVSPEALSGGGIAKIRDGDIIRLDADTGTLDALIDSMEWENRALATEDLTAHQSGLGRELFTVFRQVVTTAEQGATSFNYP